MYFSGIIFNNLVLILGVSIVGAVLFKTVAEFIQGLNVVLFGGAFGGYVLENWPTVLFSE